jgi:hypothetical protein
MYTHKISYTKQFLSGNLAGFKVEENFRTTSDALQLHIAKFTKVNKKFIVSNVTVEKI